MIARIDSGINSLNDVPGKVLAYGSRSSTSSYYFPRYMLETHGVSCTSLGGFKFSGNHTKVANDVISGVANVGGLKESVAKKNADKVKIIYASPELPSFSIMANHHFLTDNKLKKLKRKLVLLKAYDPIIQSFGKQFTGFKMAFKNQYEPVKDVIEYIEKGHSVKKEEPKKEESKSWFSFF